MWDIDNSNDESSLDDGETRKPTQTYYLVWSNARYDRFVSELEDIISQCLEDPPDPILSHVY